jgi:hypothetical protein
MTQIYNATPKESRIINKRLTQSGYRKNIIDVMIRKTYVDKYVNNHHSTATYKKVFEDEEEPTFGTMVFLPFYIDDVYNGNLKSMKTHIILSSIKFIHKVSNKYDDYTYLFDKILCHELGHINYKSIMSNSNRISKVIKIPNIKRKLFISEHEERYCNLFAYDLIAEVEIDQFNLFANSLLETIDSFT